MSEEPDVELAYFMTPEVRFGLYKEAYFKAVDSQFQYGKWVLASLLAVHAGSLLAISQAGGKTATLYAACGPLLIYGVGITLVAGGLAWINFTAVMHAYAQIMKNIRTNQESRASLVVRVLIKSTLWCTPVVALVSLILFFVAAGRATSVLTP